MTSHPAPQQRRGVESEESSSPERSATNSDAWVDFSNTWTAVNNTATSWFESAASSWKPESSLSSCIPQLQGNPGTDLAKAKQKANLNLPNFTRLIRKDMSKLSDRTVPSSEDSLSNDDSSIWEKNTGNRIQEQSKATRFFLHLSGKYHQFRQKSWPYQLTVLSLLAIIFSCFLLIGIGSRGIQDTKATNTLNDTDKLLQGAASLTDVPSGAPTKVPSGAPTKVPSGAPTTTPTTTPTAETPVTYVPGKLTRKENGLVLSEGLTSRMVARTGQHVPLTGFGDNLMSEKMFHDEPDGAAIFEWLETGGWIYVSNSEVITQGGGGVSAIYFDKDGNVVDYQRLLTGTTHNCSGGKTPWNTWISCEETEGGRVYQVDPFGIRQTEPITMDTGFFEAFAYDIRDDSRPRFFVTEDSDRGPLRRFTPSVVDWNDPWNILHGPGAIEYLLLHPQDNNPRGTFSWTSVKEDAKANSLLYYRNSEGIDVYRNQLFFTSKNQKELFILDLDAMTYEVHSTVSGVFDGMPDQVKRLVHADGVVDSLLYFCEEGGVQNGVHARDENGWFFTIFESDTFSDETTGLAFSPDGKHMYVSFQHNGMIFDIWREDGLPFHGKTLNVKYHEISD